jgi:hypothetical protein
MHQRLVACYAPWVRTRSLLGNMRVATAQVAGMHQLKARLPASLVLLDISMLLQER